MKTATISIESEIGANPTSEQLKAGASPCFSSSDMKNFIEKNKDADSFEILLGTVGGSVTHGIEIYNQLKELVSQGKQVKTVCYRADSIGSVIMLGGNVREVYNESDITIHFPFLPGDLLKNENLTSEVLQELKTEVETAENQILAIYKSELDLNDSDFIEVESLMKKETNLKGQGALKYGFATHLVKNIIALKVDSKPIAYTEKIAALLKEKTINNSMDTKVIESKLDLIMNSLGNIFKKEVKNTTATAMDGTVMYFTEDALAVGVNVFSDESMTSPIADGTYSVDGQDVSVMGGAVAQIEVIEDKTAALQAQLDAANATNADLLAKLEASTAETAQVNDKLKDLMKQVADVKAMVPNAGNIQDKTNIQVEKTPAQKSLERNRELRK